MMQRAAEQREGTLGGILDAVYAGERRKHAGAHSELLAASASPLVAAARLVLEVVPGERPLLAQFGCRVHLLGPVRTEADRHVAAALIEEALETWLPRLGVERADVVRAEENRLLVGLHAAGQVHEFWIRHRGMAAPQPPAADPRRQGGGGPA